MRERIKTLATITFQVRKVCGRSELEPSSSSERSVADAAGKSSSSIETHAAAAAPSRTLPSQLHVQLGNFLASVVRSRTFYGTLADTICEEYPDKRCWNGERVGEWVALFSLFFPFQRVFLRSSEFIVPQNFPSHPLSDPSLRFSRVIWMEEERERERVWRATRCSMIESSARNVFQARIASFPPLRPVQLDPPGVSAAAPVYGFRPAVESARWGASAKMSREEGERAVRSICIPWPDSRFPHSLALALSSCTPSFGYELDSLLWVGGKEDEGKY